LASTIRLTIANRSKVLTLSTTMAKTCMLSKPSAGLSDY
jgi:hypothetical protein